MRPLAVVALLALAVPAAVPAAAQRPPVAGGVPTIDPSRATSPTGVRASSERAYGSSRTAPTPTPAPAEATTGTPAAPDAASLLGALLGAALTGEAPEVAEAPRPAASAPVAAAHPGEPVRVRAPRANDAPTTVAPGEPVRMRPDTVTGAIPGAAVVVEE